MKLTELLLGAKVVFVSTGRSDQKARLNCISFVILYMYFSCHYFAVPESTDTEIEIKGQF